MIAIQTAIYTKLTGNAPLVALLPTYDYGGGFTTPCIFDHVPQVADGADPAPFPYVALGVIQNNENDTDTELGFSSTINIHVWSRYRGKKEAAEVQEAIYNALHRRALTAVGYGVSGIHQEFSEILQDPDGITRHGVQRFRIFYEATTTS